MTTFTSEDRMTATQQYTDPGINDEGFFTRSPWPANPWWSDVDKSWWGDKDPYPHQLNLKNIKQVEIEFFFPLTEQIPLALDTSECDTRKPVVPTTTFPWGNITATSAVSTTVNTSVLSVQPINPVGQLNIGGIQVGLEKEPTWYQRILFELLGFNWKDKN